MASKNLRMFGVEINAWLKAGCPKHNIFQSDSGLCGNYTNWLIHRGIGLGSPAATWAKLELRRTWGGGLLPFNKTRDSYLHERDRGLIYCNIMRKTHMRTKLSFQTEDLRAFYKALNSWIDRGCPSRVAFKHFSKQFGLCRNLYLWADAMGMSRQRAQELTTEMQAQFKTAGLDLIYPFNRAPIDYDRDSAGLSHYDNLARLVWVEARAQGKDLNETT